MTDRCQAEVMKRDTYRVDRSTAGKRRGGFSMHYTRDQCARAAVKDGLCAQHGKIAAEWSNMPRSRFDLPYEPPRRKKK